MDFKAIAARALTPDSEGSAGDAPGRERQRDDYDRLAVRWRTLLPDLVLPCFQKAALDLASFPDLAAQAMANGVHHGRPPGFPTHKAAMLVLSRGGQMPRTLFCAPAYSGNHVTFYTVVGPRQIEYGAFDPATLCAEDVDRVLALFIQEALSAR